MRPVLQWQPERLELQEPQERQKHPEQMEPPVRPEQMGPPVRPVQMGPPVRLEPQERQGQKERLEQMELQERQQLGHLEQKARQEQRPVQQGQPERHLGQAHHPELEHPVRMEQRRPHQRHPRQQRQHQQHLRQLPSWRRLPSSPQPCASSPLQPDAWPLPRPCAQPLHAPASPRRPSRAQAQPRTQGKQGQAVRPRPGWTRGTSERYPAPGCARSCPRYRPDGCSRRRSSSSYRTGSQ